MATLTLNADARRFRRFAKRYLRFVEGSVTGQPVTFEPWLLRVTNDILSRDPKSGKRRYKTAYVGLAKKNNKSTWAAVLALYFLCVESERSADGGMQVYAAAASKDQAKIVFDAAKAMVEGSPELRDLCDVTRDAIIYRATRARFMVLSSDAPKLHGKNPTIVIVDELHAHESGELYDALLTAMIARDEPLLITVTNAGANAKGDTKWAEVYRRGKAGTDPSMYFYAPTVGDDDLDNPEAWKRANPASWITVEKLLAMQAAMPPFRFQRFHLNRATRAEREWLPKGAWEACAGGTPPTPPERVIGGLDLSKSKDHTALVLVAPRGDGRYAVSAETWAAWPDANTDPPEAHHPIEGDVIPFGDIVDRLREVCATYDVAEIAYDPWGIPDMIADQLVAEGVPLVKYPQTPTLMCPASQGLFEAVTAGDIEHDGGEILASHIAAATPKDVRQFWRLDKDAARSPSDAAIALAMALDRAREWGPADENDFVIRYG